jgi:hypothetical protein
VKLTEKDKKDTLTFIPINNKLKALGVTKFVRQSNIIEIGFRKGQILVFDIDPKKVTKTRENLEIEAKKCQGLTTKLNQISERLALQLKRIL